jgi:hypothetical protein
MNERKRRPWGRWLAGLIVLALAVTAGGFYLRSWRSSVDLEAALAELDAADPNWRILDLLRSRPELLEEHNSVPRILAVTRALPPSWPDHNALAMLEKHPPNRQLAAAQGEALTVVLNGTPRDAARELIRFPRGRFELVIPENPLAMRLPDHGKANDVALLLSLDSWRRALDGDGDGALLSSRAGVNVSRAMIDDPTLIGQMMRNSTLRTTLLAAERVLALAEPSDAALEALANELKQETEARAITFALRAERANLHTILKQVAAGDSNLLSYEGAKRWVTMYRMRESARREHPALLRFMTKLVEASRLPDAEQLEAGEEIDREVRDYGGEFANLLLPSFAKITGADRRGRCAAAAMRGLIAVELYRRRHGRWPEKVPEGCPPDPIDGAPLRLKRTADGVVVYSIGNDRKDGGGDVEGWNNDIGFRLWDVEKRRARP